MGKSWVTLDLSVYWEKLFSLSKPSSVMAAERNVVRTRSRDESVNAWLDEDTTVSISGNDCSYK
jgi:hypothetical protein